MTWGRCPEAERGSPGGGIDFAPAYDLLFEDLDFEMLYDPAVNGIESDPIAERVLRIANLEFENWFEPFAGRHVHPSCTSDLGRRGRGAV